MPLKIARKALFLDRDGVINQDHGYVYQAEKCDFVPGIQELLQAAKAKNYFIVVVTNQSGIGRGYYTEQDFHQFMSWMNAALDNSLDAIYFCPFHPTHGVGEYKQESSHRKPNAGMLLQAIAEHNLDIQQSFLVGDSEKDIIAANKAHLKQAFYYSQERPPSSLIQSSIAISSLEDVIAYL